MSGDYSRKSFDKKKHYSAVQLQQGRVLLDADWNEQVDILHHLERTESKDVIGKTGVPKKGSGFKITVSPGGNDLEVSNGRIYVDGILCELDKSQMPVTYQKQPYYPNPGDPGFLTSPVLSPPASPPAGIGDKTYIAYLDVWEREVTALNDPQIQEVALGSADTSTRKQVVWQVKLLEVKPNGNGSIDCKSELLEWKEKIAPPSGKLNAHTIPVKAEDKVCLPSSNAGYTRLENQLYRVEVHKMGTRNLAKFKWSRDNGSVLTPIMEVNGTVLTVAHLGKDDILGFKPGNWVEIIDDEVAFNTATKPLFQIDTIDPDTKEITLKSSANNFKNKKNLKLSRWDQTGNAATTEGIAMKTGWVKIENGLEIEFRNGNYNKGDYWLIPARTATGEIEWPPFEVPNTNPSPQAPKGIKHHYCKLALIEVKAGIPVVTDCRKSFPSLTNIEAKDVFFNNNHCNLDKADNVQEAIDLLCAGQDLREHNKFIHGYGVVCGLKVICAGSRTNVLVEKGYALDCNGDVIKVNKKQEVPYNIVEQAASKNLLDANGNGKVSLLIKGSSADGPDLAIEKYVKKDFWDEVLEGSLLKNFYNGCIQNLFDFLKKNFPFNFTDTAPIPLEQRRITALINLFSQLINSQTGPYGFLSGKRLKDRSKIKCENEKIVGKYEDFILWCLYKGLKDLLDSETYCAMFDNDVPFPFYETDPGLETIFGPVLKLHYKIRLHPNGEFAYTCGFNNKIYVYNLKEQALLQSVEFPVSKSLNIQDMVLGAKGDKIYGLGVLDDKDSVFAVGNINAAGKINWERHAVKCGQRFHALAVSSKNNFYVSQLTQGIFEVKDIGLNSFNISNKISFNSTGMFILSKDEKSFFAAEFTTTNNESQLFSQITQFNVSNSSSSNKFIVEGHDFGSDIMQVEDILYVTGNVQGTIGSRILCGFTLSTGNKAFNDVTLESSWRIKMDYVESPDSGKNILLSMSDRFKVSRVILGGNNPVYDEKFRISTQMFPMGVVIHSENAKAYALNYLVNTLTDIDLKAAFEMVNPPNFVEEPPYILADYRDGVIEAYGDVLGHFLQYLKDCFTDKFLIDCPECSENDKVYLASVEIENKKVHHINNFSMRKYVKTPELWEYWLSTVPILPMVKEKFKEFCGTVL